MSKKKIFSRESEMQDWLREVLGDDVIDFGDLIVNREEIEQYKATSGIAERIKESYLHCLRSFECNYVIADNENISLKAGESLSPDFLVYSAVEESILIVELKTEKNASRQAGTELGAYAGEIKSYFPFIADGDLPCVIISTVWPILLRHYVFHEIFWHHRNVICLAPVSHDGKIRLSIQPIADILVGNETMKFSERHFAGYHISMYGMDNLVVAAGTHEQQMRTALIAMSSKGNKLKSHGFAFLSKAKSYLPATYAITVATLAPFQTFERFLHDESLPKSKLFDRIGKLIASHDPSGQGASLAAITEQAEKFLTPICSPAPEGFHTWNTLKIELDKKSMDVIAFASWGFVEELFLHELLNVYSRGENYREFSDAEVGRRVVDGLFDPNYNFINIGLLGLFANEEE